MGIRRVVGCVPAVAILVAPFLALRLGPEAGLAAAVAALVALALFGLGVARQAEPGAGRRLRALAAVNLVLAVACAVTLAVRLWR